MYIRIYFCPATPHEKEKCIIERDRDSQDYGFDIKLCGITPEGKDDVAKSLLYLVFHTMFISLDTSRICGLALKITLFTTDNIARLDFKLLFRARSL